MIDVVQHTSDPEAYQNPIKEGAGAVASDSLAAESARSGGGFGDNRDSNPLSVSGSHSTFANEDTSGATTLPPARDAQTRDNQQNQTGAGEKYPEGAGGQGSFPGSHAGGTYSGGPSGAKSGSQDSSKGDSYSNQESGGAFSDSGASKPDPDKISSSTGNPSSATSGTGGSGSGSGETGSTGGSDRGQGGESDAPGYVSSVTQPLNTLKPKGNVTEGSDEDFKGPNSQDADIGSEDDPGRRAELEFQKMTQQSAGSTTPKQGGKTNEGQYGVLEGDQGL